MIQDIYLSLFILSMPLLLMIGRKTHFFFLDRKLERKNNRK